MKLNVRGLAGTCAVAAFVGLAGCVTVTAPTPGTGNGANSPRPSATASTATGTMSPSPGASMSPGAAMSPGASASTAPVAFKCETPVAVTLATGNTDFDKAQAVSACSTITATLPGEGEGDRFFKVSIPAGVYDGRLKVTVEESSTDYIPSLRIFNAAKADRSGSSADDGTATPLVHEQDVSAGKDYYVKLNEPTGATPIKLRFEFVPTVDVYERNDTPDTARMLTSGQTVNVVHFAGIDTLDGDDVDYFKIDVPAGKTKITVKVANKSTAAEGQIWNVRVLDSARADVGGGSSANSQADLMDETTVEAAGTYYLKLSGGTNSTVASQLTVTVQ